MNGIKYAYRSRFDNKCTISNFKRRLCLKSQPVRFVDQFPSRRKKTIVSTMHKKKFQNKDDDHKQVDFDHNELYDEPDFDHEFATYPDIYIDQGKDDNCITTVRRTCSKIKWSQPPKISRYHKKCSEKENVCNKIPKKRKQRKVLASESDIEKTLISELEARKKFLNECYCVDKERIHSENDKRCVKPVIISDGRKKHYSKNTVENARRLLNYEPESKFLKDVQTNTKMSDCKCSSCIMDRLEKSMKYTNIRNVIEKGYSSYPEPEIKKQSNCCYMHNKMDDVCSEKKCLCKIHSFPEIRKQKFTGTNQPKDKSCSCKTCRPDVRRCKTAETHKECTNKSCMCNIQSTTELASGTTDNDVTYLSEHKLCAAKGIRNDNYFETHSISPLNKNVIPHKCIYKFELDNRLLPTAVNTDCWGQSRCEVCCMPYLPSKDYQKDKKVDKQFQVPSKPDLTDKSVSEDFSTTSNANSLLTMMTSSQKDLQRVPSSKSRNHISKIRRQNAEVQCLPNYVDKQTSFSSFSKHSVKCGSQTCFCASKGTSPKKIYYCCKGTNTGTSPTRPNFCCKSTTTSLGPKLSSGSRKINIGDSNSIVELNTDAALLESKVLGSNRFFEKCKRAKIRPTVIPNNSLALRYQKGVF